MARDENFASHLVGAKALLRPAEVLRNDLANSVAKLRDSNRQLQAAIDTGDRDPELRTAIGVNLNATLTSYHLK